MPSEAFTNIVAMMEANDTLRAPIAERRAAVEQGFQFFPVAPGAVIEEVDAGGVPAEWVATPDARDDVALLYLHGGAYTICSPRTHRSITSGLSARTRARVLAADYRLAPEHPFPAAVDDALTAYRFLLDGGVSADRLAVAGDSAGGGLSIALLVAARDAGLPLPAAAAVLSPWTDLELTGETMDTKADVDPMLNRERLKESADAYLSGTDARAPLASPIYADLSGLPPLFIHVGGRETLLDDAHRLAARAKQHGVDVTLEIEEEMIHIWHVFAGLAPEGDAGLDRVGAFLLGRLS